VLERTVQPQSLTPILFPRHRRSSIRQSVRFAPPFIGANREYIDGLLSFKRVGAFQTFLGNDKDYLTSRVAYKSLLNELIFFQVKTGHHTDKGPAWISRVRFNKSWKTAYWHGKTLHRWPGMFDANFYDVETHEEYWLSGPHRDQSDTRYSNIRPQMDDDVHEAYEAFLGGAPLPGRESG